MLPFVVRPSVCPSVRPSVRQQFTSISSYTIDARINKLICMIPLCIQMVTTYLQFFYYFQFWNDSDFSDFTTKFVQIFQVYGGMPYTSYIIRVLSCDFQITSENGNIDGGGGFLKKIVCYFSLPASPPTPLMLESPNLYAWYPYAYRWWQRIWNFSTSFSLKNQILVILPKNAISLGIYHEISSNFLSVWGVSYTSYIKRVLSCAFQITPANGNIDRGGGFWKKFVTSVYQHLLLHYWY